MNQHFLWFFVLSILTLVSPRAFANPCENFSNPRSVIDCVLERHPNILRQTSSQRIGESLEKQAKQRINPEIDDQSVFGENQNQSVSNHQINLAHTIETGGKRSARMDFAKAESSTINAQTLHTKEEIFMNTVKSLYRIRQVHAEMKILNEALETFGKIQGQFKSRPRLGPEQEVSLSVFQLAQGDYQLRMNELQTEEQTLETSIELGMGMPFPHMDEVLPTVKKQWPVLDASGADFQNSEFRLAQAEMTSAKAKLNLAKSEAWPNVKLGPSVQQTSDGISSYWQYGFNIAIPLPLFQTNAGGRTVASLELARADQNLGIKRRELEIERKILFTQYKNATQSLQQAVSFREIEQRHKKIDQLFERGVVTSSLVIEAHRQMLDFTRSQHSQEINAIEAWMKIRALEGKLFEGEI
jgi:cobalt-zinc-cadmium efflux system outer membrane protein